MFVRAYLGASTEEQDASRARADLEEFAKRQGLKGEISRRGVRVVALDLSTSWIMMKTDDELTTRMMDALNGMMLDMLAAIARKDYSDRRRRQSQGIAKAKGKYKGRPVNTKLHQDIRDMLGKSHSWSDVSRRTGASRSTIARAAKGGNI